MSWDVIGSFRPSRNNTNMYVCDQPRQEPLTALDRQKLNRQEIANDSRFTGINDAHRDD